MKLKNYETIFILTPVLSDTATTNVVAKFRDCLLARGAEIIHEQNIGLKKLAYPIQHKSVGIYYLIEFKAKSEVISVLETAYKRDERVMRFLTLVLDKHGVVYNQQQRRDKLAAQAETKQEAIA